MPLNNEYKRYFIILQEDDKGYEIAAGKIPTGYVKIEIKNGRGKLTAYAQNVKYGDKIDYKMLLIAPSKKAAVDMGRLMVDSTGRGELNTEFDADNVMRSGMDITDFMVAAISTSTAIPLSGYTGRDKVQWKNAYNIVNKPADRIDKKQLPVEEVVTQVQPKPVEIVQPIEMNIPQAIPENIADVVGKADVPKANIIETAKDVVENVVDAAKDVVENVVEGAVDVVGNVIEGAKDVVGDVVENVVEGAKDVVEDVVGNVVEGAKDIVGGVKQSVKNVIEYVVDDNEGEVKPVEETAEPAKTKPNVEPASMKPNVEPASMKPTMNHPRRPLFENETPVKEKFIIENEEPAAKAEMKHQHMENKPVHQEIDYKNYYYYDDDCDCDSDSDSDSDDRDKTKGDKDKKNAYYESPMYRRLEKVLGRLRETDPFDGDEDREKWFKVEDDIYLLNSATIPFMGSMMPLGYPYMSNECVMMIGRKDYIIGVKYSKGRRDKKCIKHVMFGIPGLYNKQEERYYNMRGFMKFKPHKSRNYGYWIMTVDITTGEIVMK